MATVGTHQQSAFASPSNGDALDATVVKGNDNAIVTNYNAHDNDATIHVQTSVAASRPAAGTTGRLWFTTDDKRWAYDTGAAWVEPTFNNLSVAGTLGVTGVATFTAQPVMSSLTASQAVFTDASKGLVSNAITGTGNVVMSASPTFTGTVTAATLNATTLGGTLSTAAQTNITSVGTLSSLTVSGDLTVDTSTLKVDSANNRVGIGTATPSDPLHVEGASMLLKNGTSNVDLKLGITGYGMSLTYATGDLRFRTNATDRMTLDNSGNLGLGVTPSAWTTYKALDVSGGGGFISANNAAEIWSNAFFDGAVKYKANGYATRYHANTSGAHAWYIAGNNTSGAGASCSFTQALTLDANGNLQLGTTTNKTTAFTGNGTGMTIGAALAPTIACWDTSDASYVASMTQIGADMFLTNSADGVIAFNTNNTERLRVKNGGQTRFVPLTAAPTVGVEDGDVYYDSGTNKLRVRAGGAWVDLH